MSNNQTQRAFILRITLGGKDDVEEALKKDELIIGFSYAKGLLEENLSWENFREIIHNTYYKDDKNYQRSGRAAGNIWRFIREMKKGDLVIVPRGPEFFIAEIKDPAYYIEEKIKKDAAYRRPVQWLNNKKPIPRQCVRAALQMRMKVRQACVDATDLIEEIKDAIAICKEKEIPTFEKDLRQKLIEEALKEIRTGRINDYGFERLVENILIALGAKEVRIIPRNLDKGADIIANFNIANTFKYVLAVQAKHFMPDPPVGSQVVEELLQGMEAESADIGWVVTSGTFSNEAIVLAEKVLEEQGRQIKLIDGEDLASLIIENGLNLMVHRKPDKEGV